MTIQGTQYDVLTAVVTLQDSAEIKEVEDVQIAEEVDLEVNVVHNALETLAEDGYVKLEKVERLSGKGYIVGLTSKGEDLVEEDQHS